MTTSTRIWIIAADTAALLLLLTIALATVKLV